MPESTTQPDASGVRRALSAVKTVIEFTVAGAPDTRNTNRPRSITIRPEKVRLVFRDGRLRWLSVWGRTIRRDGSITMYREVGFSGYDSLGDVDDLPDWVAAILDDEGVDWPGGDDVDIRTKYHTSSPTVACRTSPSW